MKLYRIFAFQTADASCDIWIFLLYAIGFSNKILTSNDNKGNT